jgi:predicted acyl esterase
VRRVLLVLVSAVLAFSGVIFVANPAGAAASFGTSYVRIPSHDGTEISAVVLTPTGQGDGPFPLVVMPSSWGVNALEYVGQGAKLATAGYEVVSYTSRGFYESGGQIDIDGPPTIADVSSVIDWALAHTAADPDEIASVGISYGAGASLLAAARDPRIKVAGALSGWADLLASIDANDTVSLQAVAALLALGNLVGRPGPEMSDMQTKFLTGDNDGAVAVAKQLAPARSATNEVDAINANHPAMFLANAFEDSIFPPAQYTDFFTKLTGPKRLLLAHGDHATNDATGAVGLPSEVWDQLTRWLDHYLGGADNGVDTEPAVRLKSQNGTWRSYPSWAATGTYKTSYLTKPDGLDRTGSLGGSASTGWSYGIGAAVPTIADSGVALLSGLLQGTFSIPTGVLTPLVDRSFAGVWSGPSYSSPALVSGAARLHVTVTPSAADTSLFAYLYDVDSWGTGSLIAHKPYSIRGATPGHARGLDIRLEATSWEVPAGHHLVLAVDTVDPRYLGVSTLGSTVRFSSPSGDPSWLKVPLG